MAKIRPGQELAGYQIRASIGKGGMGEIWLAKQVSIGRDVALKILAPNLVIKDPRFAERFIAEAQAAGRLNHPGIIAVHDVGQAEVDGETIHYFSMEYVDGENFRQIIDRDGPCDEELIGRVMQTMAEGLAYAHGLGMIHRDIKPENIMMTRDGRIKLADFGLAMQVDNEEEQEKDRDESGRVKVMGTPLYMSPEQARGIDLDFRSDHYSLGATLYSLLTAKFPYARKKARDVMRAHVRDPIPDPLDVIDCPESWRRLSLKLMQKKGSDRFASPEELIKAVEGCQRGSWPPRRRPRHSTEHLPHKDNKQTFMIVGIIAAVVLLLAVGLYSLSGTTTPRNRDAEPANISPTTGNQDLALKAAQKFIDRLPDDPEIALGEIEGRNGLGNPYYKNNADAAALLQQEASRLAKLWETKRQAIEAAAKRSLDQISQQLKTGDYLAAEQALKKIPADQRKLANDQIVAIADQLTAAIKTKQQATITEIAQAKDASSVDRIVKALDRRRLPSSLIVAAERKAAERNKQLQAAAQAARTKQAEDDKQTITALITQFAGWRANYKAGKAPDWNAMYAASNKAYTQLHDKNFKELAKQLTAVCTRAKAVDKAVDTYLRGNNVPMTVKGDRLKLTGRAGLGLAADKGGNQVQVAFTQSRLPLKDILKKSIDKAGLKPATEHTASFLWCWNLDEAYKLLIDLGDHPLPRSLDKVDKRLAEARSIIDEEWNYKEGSDDHPFTNKDVRISNGLLSWTPKDRLKHTTEDFRRGDVVLNDSHLRSLTWELGPVKEVAIDFRMEFEETTAFLSISRGGTTYRIMLNSIASMCGLYRSTASKQMELLHRADSNPLRFAADEHHLKLALSADGRVSFHMDDWHYEPRSGKNLLKWTLPGKGPVTVSFDILPLDVIKVIKRKQTLHIESITAEGRRP